MKFTSLIAGLVLVGFASVAQAQTPVPSPTPTSVRLGWDAYTQTAAALGFRLFDTQGTSTVKVGADITPSTVTSIPFPALTPGVHVLTLKAFNADSESPASNALSVRVFVTLTDAPAGLRIITAKFIDGLGWVPTLEFV